jgi:hypothetical protein
MNEKPILRLFADYCCGFALWNNHDHDILSGSEEQLLEIGILPHTIVLLKAIVYVHDWEPSDEEPSNESNITYDYLVNMAKVCLEKQIGDKFTIVTLER